MAKVLVTGANGFIGTALLPRLAAAGFTPRVFTRRPFEGNGVEAVRGDLAEPGTLAAAVAGTDAVVHLGAATSVGGLDPSVSYKVTRRGSAL